MALLKFGNFEVIVELRLLFLNWVTLVEVKNIVVGKQRSFLCFFYYHLCLNINHGTKSVLKYWPYIRLSISAWVLVQIINSGLNSDLETYPKFNSKSWPCIWPWVCPLVLMLIIMGGGGGGGRRRGVILVSQSFQDNYKPDRCKLYYFN